MNFIGLKNESGILRLRGGLALIFLIALAVGTIVGLIIGAFSGDWYIASICGFLLLINIIINLVIFIINKIKTKVMLPSKIIKWLKGEKGLTDFEIKNYYLKDDIMASILRDKAKEEYKKENS